MTKPKRLRLRKLAILVATLMLVITFRGVTALGQGQGVMRDGQDVSLNDGLPREVENVTVVQNLGERIPLNLPLFDAAGREVSTGSFINGNQPAIITLNYSNCPMLCNVQLNQLAKSLNELKLKIGEDFQILTVSIDPKETTETAQKTKQKYVEQVLENHPQAEQGWEFCTAEQATITKLAEILGFQYNFDPRSGEYYHPAMLAFISPEGVISRYSLAVSFEPSDMRKALVEAGEGAVGSPVDQFLLLCFSYDPSSNSYVPHAWKIMRLAGFATICLMLACLAPYWIGRKRLPNDEAEESAVEPQTT